MMTDDYISFFRFIGKANWLFWSLYFNFQTNKVTRHRHTKIKEFNND